MAKNNNKTTAQPDAGKIPQWAEKILDSGNNSSKQAIARLSGETYTTGIVSGNHFIFGDEPESEGGDDRGLSPYDLLSSALAACTAMTIRMYASRKEWDLEEVRVKIEHSKEYAKDCDTCEHENSRIDTFSREIELEGDLDDSQKSRLLEIANKCPVHRTLQGDILIETRLMK